MKTLDKRFKLLEAERRLRKGCKQIELLKIRLSGIEKRYDKCKSRAVQYNLKIQLCTIKGVLIMYNEYVQPKLRNHELRRDYSPKIQMRRFRVLDLFSFEIKLTDS